MKKNTLLALLLAVAMLLCACSAKDTTSEATPAPTEAATEAPTEEPTAEPTEAPTAEPTEEPTAEPTEEPTAEPTEEPTAEPTEAPTAEPTEAPTAEPTEEPTAEPTEAPADEPADETVALSIIGGADGATAIVVTEDETAEETETAAAEEPAEIESGEEIAQETDDANPVLATAYAGEITVTRDDVQADFDQSLANYINMYTQYGYTIDEYDVDFQAGVAEESVQLLLSQRIVEREAVALGYELTAEKEAAFLEQAQTMMQNLRAYYETYLSYYGYTGEDLEAIVEEEIAASGYSVDSLYESIRLNDMLDYLFGIATADVTVTEEEVAAAYEEKIAAAQAAYADVDAYINDYLSGVEILYTPEGLRTVQCIYIAPFYDEEGILIGEEATASEATPSDATPSEETVSDPSELAGIAKAKAVRALIADGLDFMEAMSTYNEDSSSVEELEAGYPVAADSVLYDEAFVKGAMALENIGDVSDVIVTGTGCFILRYASDIEPGSPALETRLEAETEELLETKKGEVFSAYISGMLDAADIQIIDLSPLYHVFVSQTVEATIAYASVSEETALTDMPDGIPVATLSAGASLDVLGHIGMDGEEYAFVAVPGTDFKGYVNVTALSDMDEEAALAVDNASLAAAAEVPAKLPTFTIAMNDGSLIYGELYPDVTPESVGNFVELADSGFYDGLTFHRVIAGFMIQGGDPNGNGSGGPGYAILGEFASNGVTNDLSHTRGVLSMARSAAANSGGSQFFIMHADSPYLDGEYAGFGMVLGGIETVDVIASTPTDANDRPMTEQTMRTVYVETYGQTYPFTKLED